MTILEVIILAIVQGVTEFLPVSSSGHLVLGAWILGADDPGVAFDVAVHVGTLLALVVVFRAEGWALLAEPCRAADGRGGGRREQRAAAVAIADAGRPGDAAPGRRGPGRARRAGRAAARPDLGGRLPHRHGRDALVRRPLRPSHEAAGDGRARDSLRIGVAQAVAVLPGVSRSGMCMAAGMLHDVTREGSALFALYLAAPAIGGAGLWAAYQLATDGAEAGVGVGEMALGAAVAFLVAVVAIRGLLALVRAHSLRVFVVYCLGAGAAVVVARALGL